MGGPHEVLVEHLEHRRAYVARPAGDLLNGERGDRQDEMPRDVERIALAPERLEAEQREPSEHYATEVEEIEPEEERRDGVADRRHGRDDPVRPAVLAYRGEDAERNRHHDGDDERGAAEEECRGQPLGDLAQDRLA